MTFSVPGFHFPMYLNFSQPSYLINNMQRITCRPYCREAMFRIHSQGRSYLVFTKHRILKLNTKSSYMIGHVETHHGAPKRGRVGPDQDGPGRSRVGQSGQKNIIKNTCVHYVLMITWKCSHRWSALFSNVGGLIRLDNWPDLFRSAAQTRTTEKNILYTQASKTGRANYIAHVLYVITLRSFGYYDYAIYTV